MKALFVVPFLLLPPMQFLFTALFSMFLPAQTPYFGNASRAEIKDQRMQAVLRPDDALIRHCEGENLVVDLADVV